jgi:hypothetical protein
LILHFHSLSTEHSLHDLSTTLNRYENELNNKNFEVAYSAYKQIIKLIHEVSYFYKIISEKQLESNQPYKDKKNELLVMVSKFFNLTLILNELDKDLSNPLNLLKNTLTTFRELNIVIKPPHKQPEMDLHKIIKPPIKHPEIDVNTAIKPRLNLIVNLQYPVRFFDPSKSLTQVGIQQMDKENVSPDHAKMP